MTVTSVAGMTAVADVTVMRTGAIAAMVVDTTRVTAEAMTATDR